jgi:hypothetical protein
VPLRLTDPMTRPFMQLADSNCLHVSQRVTTANDVNSMTWVTTRSIIVKR